MRIATAPYVPCRLNDVDPPTSREPIAARVASGTSPQFWSKLSSLAGAAPTTATNVVPLRDSAAAARERLALIGSATKSIVATVYCLAPDEGGVAYIQALRDRARAGVKVIFARDGIAKLANGSLGDKGAELERAIDELREAGATVLTFGGVVENVASLGSGLHLKALLVDGERAISGGRNIGLMFDSWPDFDVRFEGPIVASLTLQSLPALDRVVRRSGEGLLMSEAQRMAFFARVASLESDARKKQKPPAAEAPRYLPMVADPVALNRGFERKENPITAALIAAIDQTKSKLSFSSNYIRLVPEVAAAIVRARARGVEITAVTTGLSASKLSTMSYYDAEDDYAWLRAQGVRVVETNVQDHAKVFVFDDSLLMFGSYNVEHQAHVSLVEGVVFTDDARLIAAARAALQETIETRAETLEQHLAAEPSPFVAFFKRIFAFLLSPFL